MGRQQRLAWPVRRQLQDLLRRKNPREGNKIWPMPPNEQRNFLDCVKSRKPTTYTAEADQRLSTTMHIGNIAMQLGRKLKWDPQERIVPRRRSGQRPAQPASPRRLEEEIETGCSGGMPSRRGPGRYPVLCAGWRVGMSGRC